MRSNSADRQTVLANYLECLEIYLNQGYVGCKVAPSRSYIFLVICTFFSKNIIKVEQLPNFNKIISISYLPITQSIKLVLSKNSKI